MNSLPDEGDLTSGPPKKKRRNTRSFAVQVVTPSRDVFDSLNIDEGDFKNAMENRKSFKTRPTPEYDLLGTNSEVLYNDILSYTNNKDNRDYDNFNLNIFFMLVLRDDYSYIYEPLLQKETTRLDFFTKVFDSSLFHKNFLTEKGTGKCVKIDEDFLITTSSSTSQANQYDLEEKSAKDLYDDILCNTEYKDNSNSDNFELNRPILVHIKMEHNVFGNFMKSEVKRLDFFKKVFKSFLFFKHFLIVKKTGKPLELYQ